MYLTNSFEYKTVLLYLCFLFRFIIYKTLANLIRIVKPNPFSALLHVSPHDDEVFLPRTRRFQALSLLLLID